MSVVTSNLGLVAWDLESDDFEHSQLADNWVRIDEHSHLGALEEATFDEEGNLETGHWVATGRGLAIKTGAIEPEAIAKYLIKQRAVGHLQLGLQQVFSENIKNKNVLDQHIGDEQVKDRAIEEHTITIDKFEPGILPLGSVMLWFRAKPEETPGDIWEVCDGRNWHEISNAWGLTEGQIPDMRGRFARGTDVNGTGTTGGNASVDLKHHHNVSTSALAHNHLISGDGNHRHGFADARKPGGPFHQLFQRVTKYKQVEGAQELQSVWDTFTESPGEQEVVMEITGQHAHGGATGGSSLGGGGADTDERLSGIDTTPPYVGLVYVMRVR
jgi:hypothetical protein